MARSRTGTYRLVGRGSDLAIEVSGPDPIACLEAAVAGFAASLAEVDADLPRQRRDLVVDGDAPDGLLVNLLDEAITALDTEGRLAVGLAEANISGGRLRALLEVVDLDAVTVHGPAPKAATWHEARLEQVAADRWEGAVMLDL